MYSTTTATVDTSRPFRSVREAVAIFGDKLLVGETQLSKPPFLQRVSVCESNLGVDKAKCEDGSGGVCLVESEEVVGECENSCISGKHEGDRLLLGETQLSKPPVNQTVSVYESDSSLDKAKHEDGSDGICLAESKEVAGECENSCISGKHEGDRLLLGETRLSKPPVNQRVSVYESDSSLDKAKHEDGSDRICLAESKEVAGECENSCISGKHEGDRLLLGETRLSKPPFIERVSVCESDSGMDKAKYEDESGGIGLVESEEDVGKYENSCVFGFDPSSDKAKDEDENGGIHLLESREDDSKHENSCMYGSDPSFDKDKHEGADEDGKIHLLEPQEVASEQGNPWKYVSDPGVDKIEDKDDIQNGKTYFVKPPDIASKLEILYKPESNSASMDKANDEDGIQNGEICSVESGNATNNIEISCRPKLNQSINKAEHEDENGNNSIQNGEICSPYAFDPSLDQAKHVGEGDETVQNGETYAYALMQTLTIKNGDEDLLQDGQDRALKALNMASDSEKLYVYKSKPSPEKDAKEIHHLTYQNDHYYIMTILKKLEAELEETKMELKQLKEREAETEVALASLNAELHKNMSKIARAEAAEAARAAAKSNPASFRIGYEETCMQDEEQKRRDMIARNMDSPTLAQILSLGDCKGYFGKSNKKGMKVMKKKPIVPLVGDLFIWKKRSPTHNLIF